MSPELEFRDTWEDTRSEMNDFQEKCKTLVDRVLKKKGLRASFAEAGKNERYLVAQFRSPTQKYEVYIYENEAGLMVGNDWLICEQPDFVSADELIAALGRMLSEQIR